jgi:hypothetical protein
MNGLGWGIASAESASNRFYQQMRVCVFAGLREFEVHARFPVVQSSVAGIHYAKPRAKSQEPRAKS